jgi:hypothetical protein
MAAIYHNGCYAVEGDLVRCKDYGYSSIRYNGLAKVLRVEDGCIVLDNRDSPYGTSPFKASNFQLVRRAVPKVPDALHAWTHQLEQQEKKYMHVAIRTDGEGFSPSHLATQINSNELSSRIIADTNATALKEKIKARIEIYPDEVWIILGGHTVASGKRRPAVDVSFRPL